MAIKTKVKFFGPGTVDGLEKDINAWFAKRGKWFRLSEATMARCYELKGEGEIVIVAVFYEELVPCPEEKPRSSSFKETDGQ